MALTQSALSQGREGQVEGGGQRGGKGERKARQKTTPSAILLLKAFVQPLRYLVI